MRAQTSKKDDSMRATEIRKAASESLLEFVAKHGREAAMDTGGSLLVLEIMLQADGGMYFPNFHLSPLTHPIVDIVCRMTANFNVVQTSLRPPRPYSN